MIKPMTKKTHHPVPHTYSFDSQNTQSNSTWMITFADLLALLLSFFILSYAMSTVKHGQWDRITNILGKTFQERRLVDQLVYYTAPLSITTIDIKKALDLDYLHAVFTKKVGDDTFLTKNISLQNSEDALLLSIKDDALFKAETTTIAGNSKMILFVIAEALSQLGNKIEIRGYASQTKVHPQGQYPTDWELALARTVFIAEELREYGVTARIDTFVRYAPFFDKSAGDGASAESPAPEQTPANQIDIIIRQQRAENFM